MCARFSESEFNIIKSLVGQDVTEKDLEDVDCYLYKNFGLFIQSTGFCKYSIKPNHCHPAYMIVIELGNDVQQFWYKPSITIPEHHLLATVVEPGFIHSDPAVNFPNYYTVVIEKEYFESQYKLYKDKVDFVKYKQFPVCTDILKMLHLFAFESSKKIMNSDITLECQTKLLTHWIIRSIAGENMDMRSVSSEPRIGRIQTYIEMHLNENLTVAGLAQKVNMSVSNFNRLFKKEWGMSPKNYLISARLNKACQLLKHNMDNLSEIASKCGFNNISHFSAAFRKAYDTSPSAFRQKYSE